MATLCVDPHINNFNSNSVVAPNYERPLAKILREVTQKHGLGRDDLASRYRNVEFGYARQEYYYRAAVETTMSLNHIGKFINRIHSTVIHGIGAHAVRYGLPFPRNLQYRVHSTRAKTMIERRYRRRRVLLMDVARLVLEERLSGQELLTKLETMP